MYNAKRPTVCSRYDFQTADADSLIKTIVEAKRLFSPGGRGFASIALACHGPPEYKESELARVHAGAFEWSISELVSVKSAEEISDRSSPCFRVLCALADAVVDSGRVDLFACSLLGTKTGRDIFQSIERETKTNFAASEDATGNPSQPGADWVMESDGIDVFDLYFHASLPDAFTGTFGKHASITASAMITHSAGAALDDIAMVEKYRAPLHLPMLIAGWQESAVKRMVQKYRAPLSLPMLVAGWQESAAKSTEITHLAADALIEEPPSPIRALHSSGKFELIQQGDDGRRCQVSWSCTEASEARHLHDSVHGIQPVKVEFKVMLGALSLGDFDDSTKAAFAVQVQASLGLTTADAVKVVAAAAGSVVVSTVATCRDQTQANAVAEALESPGFALVDAGTFGDSTVLKVKTVDTSPASVAGPGGRPLKPYEQEAVDEARRAAAGRARAAGSSQMRCRLIREGERGQLLAELEDASVLDSHGGERCACELALPGPGRYTVEAETATASGARLGSFSTTFICFAKTTIDSRDTVTQTAFDTDDASRVSETSETLWAEASALEQLWGDKKSEDPLFANIVTEPGSVRYLKVRSRSHLVEWATFPFPSFSASCRASFRRSVVARGVVCTRDTAQQHGHGSIYRRRRHVAAVRIDLAAGPLLE